jgi:hypothetical protein
VHNVHLGKNHLKADFDRQPLAFDLTDGEASDSRRFPMLLDLGPEVTRQAMPDDKVMSHEATARRPARAASVPSIPHKIAARNAPAFVPQTLYKGRARIEKIVASSSASMRGAQLREDGPQ